MSSTVPQRRVVITGIGPVTSAGIGREAFFEGVWQQRVWPQPLPAAYTGTWSFHSKWYVPLPNLALEEHHLQIAYEKAMHPEDRMVVLGAKLALEDAGLPVGLGREHRILEGAFADVSLILGTGLSSMQTACESYLAHTLPREVLQTVAPERHVIFNRMVVPKTMPNSPAAWASICFGLTGSCFTLNTACASGTYAIGEAFRRIKDGYDQVVLTGGVESLRDESGFTMRGFDVLGVLTQSSDGWPRPFSQRRSGFLFAEGGACLLVLEELEHALRRHAQIYAEITDYRCNSDANHIVQIDPAGVQIVRLLRALAGEKRLDYLNAHGTGTAASDEVEARAVQAVFGHSQTQPLINSTKGILGHTLGASGAIEAAVTALAVARGTVHGNRTDDPIPDLNLPLVAVEGAVERALSVSYGFGGHNGGIVLEKYHA
jgi:3-oxoacyl-[acyl-carrier-protein] synthase II